MSQKSMQLVDDVATLAKTLSMDLPIAGWQWLWSPGAEETVTKVAWQGYDAGVRLATAAFDNWYRLPLTSAVLKSTAPTFLRWQRVSNAVTSTVFTGFWQTIGLPTAEETQMLRETVDQLSSDLRAQRQGNEALVNLATRIVQALEANRPLTSESAHNGFRLPSSPFSLLSARPARSHGN